MKNLALWAASLAIVIGVGAFRDDDSDQLVADSVLDAQRAARHVQTEVKARARQAALLADADSKGRAEHAAGLAVAELIASARLVP